MVMKTGYWFNYKDGQVMTILIGWQSTLIIMSSKILHPKRKIQSFKRNLLIFLIILNKNSMEEMKIAILTECTKEICRKKLNILIF
jgi:hypothetical protein